MSDPEAPPRAAGAGPSRPEPLPHGLLARRELIVTGDDFGSSAESNRAILRAHREGILTSASLLVNAPAVAEAVALARATPTLAVGLHLALSDSPATLPAAELDGLADASGRFAADAVRAGWTCFPRRRARPLEREIRAQIEKYLVTGLPMDHLDGHQHLHMHPRVFPLLVPLLGEYGVPALRLVRDDLRRNLGLDRSRLGFKLVHAALFAWLGRRCRRRARGLPIRRARRVWGLYQDGRMARDHLLGLLRDLPEGVTELYCHPSVDRGHAPGRHPDQEFLALIDPDVKAAVARRGIRLTSYGRLDPGPD
jgi:hopanoid biosynthesis associated protein HpnK